MTKRHVLLSALLIASTACLGTGGSGAQAQSDRELSAFDRIDVGGVFELRVEVGPETSITVSGDDNLVARVRTRVENERLIIDTDGGVRPDLPLIVEVTTPELRGIDASGSSTVDVRGINGERFALELSGAGKARLAGEVEQLSLELSGAGELDARELLSREATVNLSGAGRATVHATEELNADVSGAGSIVYYGDPETVHQDVSGAGRISAG